MEDLKKNSNGHWRVLADRVMVAGDKGDPVRGDDNRRIGGADRLSERVASNGGGSRRWLRLVAVAGYCARRSLRPWRRRPVVVITGPMESAGGGCGGCGGGQAGIPFNAIDNDSFKLFVEAVGQFGPGFKPPSQYQLKEPLLKGEVDRIKELLKKHEEEWARTGCSIMTDAWTDRKRRSIMNLCVNSNAGTAFLSSRESSDEAHTSELIFEYVDKCIEQVGPQNVIQVVTDNVANNMGAAKLLKVKRPNIFWTSCATHTINLMLESIGKLPKYKKVIDQAKSFTIFIYAHHKTLSLMRSFTKKRDIVRLGVTRFASAFLTLQSLMEKKAQLRAMFTSSEWEECKWSKIVKGKAAYATVMSIAFWNGVTICLKVFAPLVKVLRIVDADRKPSMGFLCGEIKQAKEDIKEVLNNLEKNYKPIMEIIEARVKDRLDSPLHFAAYLLNPYYFFKDMDIQLDNEVMDGLFNCVEMFYHYDGELQGHVINVELPKYTRKDGAFGKSWATQGCAKNDDNYNPVTWWMTYGNQTPNLQRMARKILSLTTSSSGCERNWSTFEGVSVYMNYIYLLSISYPYSVIIYID
ncbi:uncharacterized protein LOC127802188, partial [Diospyros lotus]|uniref:uncharacterized protein LOC127802188 n=1 Tax=Diospyros lotus TaxID=55363 RepID=UPI00225A49FD